MNLYVRLASIPLRIKLIIGLMVGALAMIAVLILAIVQYSQNGAPALHTMIETITQDRLDTLNLVINNASSEVAQLTNDPQNLAFYATLSISSEDAEAHKAVETAFQLVLNQQPTFRQISFVGLDGKVLDAVPPTNQTNDTGKAFFHALRNSLPSEPSYDVYVGDLGNPADPSIDFVGVSVTANHPVGYIVLEVDPAGVASPQGASFYKALRPQDSTLGTLSFYVINRTGTVVSSTLNQPVPPNNDTKAGLAELSNADNTLAFDYTSPLNGRPVTGLGLPVGQTKMVLVGEVIATPFGVSTESRQFLLPLLGLLFVSILLISGVSFFVISTIVSPVEYLLEIANRAIQGRVFDDPDPILQRDELGRLYEAFIAITRRLRFDIKTLEDSISQRTHDVEATRDIGQALSRLREQTTLMNRAVTLICDDFSEIDHARVYLVDQRREAVVLHASTSSTDRTVQLPLDEGSAIASAVLQNQPIVTLHDSDQNLLLPGIQSALSLPLVVGSTVIGVLNVQSARVDTFTEAAIRLFQTIADQLSIAINNAMLFEESQARLNEIEALNRQLIGEGWRQFSTVRRRTLLGASTESRDPNEWSDLQRRAIQTGDIVEQVTGESVTFAVPVSLRGQVIGAVEWDLPVSLYNEDNRQLARELATRLAISADNARLFEQAQRIAQRERLVNDISSKLTQQTNVSEILKIAVKEVGQALHVPQTSIRLATSHDETEQQSS